MRKPLVVLAFFVLVLGVGYAAGTYEDSIYSAVGISVAIGLTIAALGYMVGQLVGTPQIQGWAKNEVYENIYSLFLIANVAILTLAAQIFFVSLSQPPQIDSSKPITEQSKSLISIAEDRVEYALEGRDISDLFMGNKPQMKETKWTGLKHIFFSTYGFEVFLGSIGNLAQFEMQALAVGKGSTGGAGSGSATAGVPGVYGSLLPGMKQLVDLMETVNEIIILTIFMLIAHKAALVFIGSTAPMLLILGVIFRALPITRRLGSTLIALFITMGFVYPAFIAFAFSEDFYIKMVNDFSGVYVTPNWLAGIPGTSNNIIFVHGPADIVTVPSGQSEGVFNISFSSTLAPEMDYVVKDESGRVWCSSSGTGQKLEIGDAIDCTVRTTKIGNLMDKKLKDPEYEDPSKQFFDITVSFVAEAEKMPCGESYISKGEMCSYSLSFPVWVVRECESTECKQQQLIYESEWDQIRDSYIAQQTTSGFGVSGEAATADAVTTVGKGFVSYGMKKGIGKLSKETAKKGISLVGGKLFGGPLSIILALPMKSDISTGLFDEIACDAYSGAMAASYFEPDYPQPEVSSEDWSTWQKFVNLFRGADQFIVNTLKELRDSTVKMYGQSDYTACSSSLGAMNYLFGNVANWADLSKSPREYNFTILLSRVIFVFMITLFSIVITVTFFRSIAENIGGDSSLLGLGKLIE